MFDQARKKALNQIPVKWQAMIEYALYLHEGAIHAPYPPLPYSWHDAQEQSKGLYFGAWEATMAAADLAFISPSFAFEQIHNILSLQSPNGHIPARLSFNAGFTTRTSPLNATPLWPLIIELMRSRSLYTFTHPELLHLYEALTKQIDWLEKNRKSPHGGFFHLDIHDGFCESGYGLELRFLDPKQMEPIEEDSCIDATSQVYALYDIQTRWAQILELECSHQKQKLRLFIQSELYHAPSHFFYDQWHLHPDSPKTQSLPPASCLGLWPIITRSATSEQTLQILREYILNPEQFYCPHPLSSLSQNHPEFGPLGWLGPSRNSQLFWLTLGLEGYGLASTIAHLIERALDRTAEQFLRTQTLWEFYHPSGGHPQELIKFVGDELEIPQPHHLAHNPVIALAYLFKELRLH